jgi:hypothetical protein
MIGGRQVFRDWGVEMGFIVKAGRHGEGSFSAEKTTKEEAIATAAGLLAKGLEDVAITDEAGRVFNLHEFRESNS